MGVHTVVGATRGSSDRLSAYFNVDDCRSLGFKLAHVPERVCKKSLGLIEHTRVTASIRRPSKLIVAQPHQAVIAKEAAHSGADPSRFTARPHGVEFLVRLKYGSAPGRGNLAGRTEGVVDHIEQHGEVSPRETRQRHRFKRSDPPVSVMGREQIGRRRNPKAPVSRETPAPALSSTWLITNETDDRAVIRAFERSLGVKVPTWSHD